MAARCCRAPSGSDPSLLEDALSEADDPRRKYYCSMNSSTLQYYVDHFTSMVLGSMTAADEMV